MLRDHTGGERDSRRLQRGFLENERAFDAVLCIFLQLLGGRVHLGGVPNADAVFKERKADQQGFTI